MTANVKTTFIRSQENHKYRIAQSGTPAQLSLA